MQLVKQEGDLDNFDCEQEGMSVACCIIIRSCHPWGVTWLQHQSDKPPKATLYMFGKVHHISKCLLVDHSCNDGCLHI